jgi:hypothetical protein
MQFGNGKYELAFKVPSLPGWMIVALASALIIALQAINPTTLPIPVWSVQIVTGLIAAAVFFLRVVEQQEGGGGDGPHPPPSPNTNPTAAIFGPTIMVCAEHHEAVADMAAHLASYPNDHVVPLRVWNRDVALALQKRMTYAAPPPIKNVPPVVIDLAPAYFAAGGEIGNQGKIGNCTSQTAKEDTMHTAIKMGYFGPARKAPAGGFSAGYHYAWERKWENTWPDDDGAQPEEVGNILFNKGICFEKDFPTSLEECTDFPPAGLDASAANWKWDRMQSPLDPQHFAICLEAFVEQPATGSVRFALPIWPSFLDAVTNGGEIPEPQGYEAILGGHEMLVIGKDDNYVFADGVRKGAYKLQQSWGNVGAPVMRGDTRLGVMYMSYKTPLSPWIISNGGTFNYQQNAAFQGYTPTPPTPPPPTPVIIGPTNGSVQFSVQVGPTPPNTNPPGLLTATCDKTLYNQGDNVTATWKLTDKNGTPGAGRKVTWTCGTATGSFITDSNGEGIATTTAPAPGIYTMAANYAGD